VIIETFSDDRVETGTAIAQAPSRDDGEAVRP
jgi:hypothetical protein